MTESTPSFMKLQSISLLVGIWSLLLGIWTLSYIYQNFRRYKKNLLKWLFYNVLLMNLSVAIFQVVEYLHLLKSETNISLLLNRFIFAVIINSLAVVGAVYFLIKIVAKLNNVEIPKIINYVFTIILIIFILNYLFGLYLIFQFDSIKWLQITDMIVDIFAWISVFFVLIYFTFFANKNKKQIYRKISISFFYFYLVFYILWSLSVVFPEPIRYYTVFLTYIIFNLIPLIWIPKYYLKFLISTKIDKDKKTSKEFIDRFNITKREEEIINLIISGKSNKQIAKILFISSSTVRNHIYRIYQKLNINSRLKLVNLIIEKK